MTFPKERKEIHKFFVFSNLENEFLTNSNHFDKNQDVENEEDYLLKWFDLLLHFQMDLIWINLNKIDEFGFFVFYPEIIHSTCHCWKRSKPSDLNWILNMKKFSFW